MGLVYNFYLLFVNFVMLQFVVLHFYENCQVMYTKQNSGPSIVIYLMKHEVCCLIVNLLCCHASFRLGTIGQIG